MAEEKYLRSAEVAAIFNVSPKTVNRWANENKLPYVRTLGGVQGKGHRRYPEAEIRQIAASRRGGDGWGGGA